MRIDEPMILPGSTPPRSGRLTVRFLAVLICLVFTSDRLYGEETLWRRALGGEIDTYAAQGPGGDVYIVADDRALHSLDALTGESNWIYRPGGRLRSLLMVAPDGTVYVQNDRQELFAVTPGGTGRWKLRMGGEPAALPAAAPDGRVIVPLVGGRIVCVSRHGRILWTYDDRAEASAAPVVSGDGNSWIPLSDGRIIGLGLWGESVGGISVGSPISVLAMDGSGHLLVGTYYGMFAVYQIRDGENESILEQVWSARPGDGRISAIITGTGGSVHVFLVDGTCVRYEAGLETGRTKLPLGGGAPSMAADGRLYVPASDGTIRFFNADLSGQEAVFTGASVLSEPLLTDEGILISGGEDWILYAWAAHEPGGGWSQFRGGPRRAGTFPSERTLPDRTEARKDPGFFFRERQAVSEDIDDRLALIRELESYRDDRSLRRAMPWVDLLLEDLVEVGTIRKVTATDAPLVSHPTVRSSAYLIIADGDDHRSRALILDCLRHEDDPFALASGIRALGLIGTDWDGASMRIIAARYRDFQPADDHLVRQTAYALADLVRYNGGLSDPAGLGLMNELLRSPMSPALREEVIAVIRGAAGL